MLTQAGVLTLDLEPDPDLAGEASGEWVLDRSLGTPPPPPPADVPSLPEERTIDQVAPQGHGAAPGNAICASCHQRMDPIGFAFENYDAIGAGCDKDRETDVNQFGRAAQAAERSSGPGQGCEECSPCRSKKDQVKGRVPGRESC